MYRQFGSKIKRWNFKVKDRRVTSFV